MRCPECGHPNVPGSLFCERCGEDLTQAAAPAEGDQPAAAPTDGWACPACGHENDGEFIVCEACGHRRGQPVAAPTPPPPPEPHAGPEPPPVPEPPAAAEPVAEAPEPTPAPEPVPLPAPAPEPAPVPVPEPAAEAPRVDEPARRIETTVPAAPRPVPAPEPPSPVPPDASGQMVTGPRRGKVKLVVEQGMIVGRQFLLNNDEMLVGREDPSENLYPDIDLTGLDEGYVHRRHAKLAFEGSFLFVTHLGGHNRTYVNNRPIADHLAHPLNVGDTVRFGKVVMRLVEA